MSSYKYCICFTRKFACSTVAPPADVKDAFAAYAEGAAYMGPEHLRRFLVEEQGEAGATLYDAERIIERIRGRHHHLPGALARPGITLEDFFHFLLTDDLNPPLGPQVHHDMKLPLSHYYIYTGHNSYLTGNQLSSNCSDAPIIKALKRGVRVIELDMWPNSAKDNVNILHGRTLTSPVEMIKCLKSIKEHAFSASPYPVVITLEDHLTSELQSKVAKMITETFGDMLYCPETDYPAEFPSPEALKHRIIISTKPPKEKDSYETEDEDDDDDDDNDDDQNQLRRPSEPDYRGIITIHAGKPKGRLRDALNVDSLYVRRLSLSEPKFEKATESHGPALVRFTRKNILRIYPRGTRFDSSNYNPFLGWIHGAQMVAFNMQGYGRSLWLMQGLFRANGSCGYVRKPDFLMKNDPTGEVFDPKASLPVKTTLKVKIYLGDGWLMDFSPTHFDTYSPPDFYTKVGIVGVPADTKMERTKIKHDKWSPVWEEEFSFPLSVPELALLRIVVIEYDVPEKNDFGGQTCLPVWELKQGIRCVPLHDRKGDKYKSVKLLMRFQFA